MRRTLAALGALVIAAAVLASAQARNDADPLPRRGWFGVALAPHEAGALVTSVVPGSSAATHGVTAGDVIRAVDEAAMRSPEQVIAAVSRHSVADVVVIDLERKGQPLRLSVRIGELPRETLPGTTFEYGSVTLMDGSRLRTILSKPERRDGPRPAVMLIPGGGCGSIDTPLAPDIAQPGLMRTIAARGYVTMRVEKSGVGDSRGPSCETIGYRQELDGYRAALAALTRHPDVDSSQVYLLGISLGGVFAPVLARETRIRGIAVFGTLASAPGKYPGRSDRFFEEFSTVDIPAAWSDVDARVLVLHGQFDETTAEADHARIAALVNARHPGRASHQELAGLDHCWTRHATESSSKGNCGKGQEVSTLADALLAFFGNGVRS